MKKIIHYFVFVVFTLCTSNILAQVNSINIGSAQQTVNPATTFNPWFVQNTTPIMANAWSTANSAAAAPIPAGARANVIANGPAAVITNFGTPWTAGTYLSCFPFNTIYPARTTTANNATECQMTLRRNFFICSATNQTVTFNLTIACDNMLNLIVIDAGTAGAVTIYNVPAGQNSLPGITVPTAVVPNLTPGQHTIDITCANFQSLTAGAYYFDVNGVEREWNPFGISITGSITTATAALLNSLPPAITPITGIDSVCATKTITLANATPGGLWTSSNISVATVLPTGVVTGMRPGTVVISYTAGTANCARTAAFTVRVTDCHCESECDWSLTGNSNVKAWNFIGPLNAADFNIKTNNTLRIKVPANGITNIPVGLTYPALLIAPDGTLYRSTSSLARPSSQTTTADPQQQIDLLKEELATLKKQVETLTKLSGLSNESVSNCNTLEISPNPFSTNAVVSYKINDFKGNAVLQVLDINSNLIKSYSINQSNGKIEIGPINTASSVVIIKIVSEGKVLISKKSIKI